MGQALGDEPSSDDDRASAYAWSCIAGLIGAFVLVGCGDDTIAADTGASFDASEMTDTGSDAGDALGPTPAERLRDQSVECRIRLPDDAGSDVACLDLANGTHVIVFDIDVRADPVVVLMGGPALQGYTYVPHLDRETRRRRFGERPVLYLEQRGVGTSGGFQCAIGEPFGACGARAREQGISLESLRTADAADDVAAVADSLGFEQVAIAGGSYGSRLGLEVLRRYPTRIRAAYLESVVGPGDDFLDEYAQSAGDALDELSAECARQTDCAALGPLDSLLAQGVERDEENADAWSSAMLEGLYYQDVLPALVAGIAGRASGDTASVDAFFAAAFSRTPRVEPLTYQVIVCADLATSFDAERYEGTVDSAPAILQPALRSLPALVLPACDALDVLPSAAETREPVSFDGPVLLVGGTLDSRASRAARERVAAALGTATSIEHIGRSHTPGLAFQYEGSYSDTCAEDTLRAFLARPDEPAVACTDSRSLIE